jgi:alpha-tubulin suppressor-like RCC1 family protein
MNVVLVLLILLASYFNNFIMSQQISSGTDFTCAISMTGKTVCFGSNAHNQLNAPQHINFTQLTSGSEFSCGLESSGSMHCWGNVHPSILNDMVKKYNTFVQIDAGYVHVCGLLADKTVVCAGENDRYQTSVTPNKVFQSISAGGKHSCGLDMNNLAVCWGDDYFQQYTDIPREPFIQLIAGGGHTCGLRANGIATCVGYPANGQILVPPATKFVALEGGNDHTCGILTSGNVICFGLNEQGQSDPPPDKMVQLSLGARHSCGVTTHSTLVCWGSISDVPPSLGYAKLFPGASHTCSILVTGNVLCFGDNGYKELDPSTAYGTQYKLISSGTRFACAILQNNMSYCWGTNTYDIVTRLPKHVVFKSVQAGFMHACGLLYNSSALCFGKPKVDKGYSRDYGQVIVPSDMLFSSITVGLYHTCGVLLNGQGMCWGFNNNGQASPPVHLNFLELHGGTYFTCGLLLNRTALCFGSNEKKQLEVPKGAVFKMISTYPQADHVCGILLDDTTICWGDNSYGQLNISRHTSSFIDIQVGANHTCGMLASGEGICFGNNQFGQTSVPFIVSELAPLFHYKQGRMNEPCLGCYTPTVGYISAACGGSCAAGYYGTGLSLTCNNSCPIGNYCPERSNVPTPCPAGRFGGKTGLEDLFCSEACPAGYYCPIGTSNSTANICVSGYYCPAHSSTYLEFSCQSRAVYCNTGASQPTEVPLGYYSIGYNKSTGSQATNITICPKTKYCQGGVELSCNPGYFNNRTGASQCIPCPQGSISNGGIEQCKECDAGYYTIEHASVNCVPCSPGYFKNKVGSGYCEICSLGKYSTSSASSCIQCDDGYYTLSNASAKCIPCTPGTFLTKQFASSLSSCIDCDAGYFQTNFTASTCSACAPGSFVASNGSAACSLCSPGHYTSNLARTVCSPCELGKYQPQFGESTCIKCDVGYYTSVEGSSKCVYCPTIVNAERTSCASTLNCKVGEAKINGECIKCPPGTQSPGGLTTICEPCLDGLYNIRSGSGDCYNCFNDVKYGLQCAGGNATIQPSYWAYVRLDEHGEPRLKLIQCPSAGLCPGNFELYYNGPYGSDVITSGLLLNHQDINSYVRLTDNSPSKTQCGPNRIESPNNYLCGECIEGMTEWRSICTACDTKSWLIFLILLASFIYVIILHLLSSVKQDTIDALNNNTNADNKTKNNIIHTNATSADVKILIYFIQTSLFQIGSADKFLEWLQIFNFNPIESTGNSCPISLSPYQRLALQAIIPLIFVLQLFIIMTVHYILSKVLDSNKTKFNYYNYNRTFISLFLFSYQAIVQTCFKYLQCIEVGPIYVVFSVPAIKCNTDEYNYWRIIIILLLIIIVALTPIILFIFLYKKRKLIQNTGINMLKYWGILYEQYKSNCYYWNIIVLIRQVLLVILNYIFFQDYRYKYLFFTYFNVFIFILQLIFRPYNKYNDNILEFISQLILILITIFIGMNDLPLLLTGQIYLFILVIPFIIFMAIVIIINRKLKIVKYFNIIFNLCSTNTNNTGKVINTNNNDTNGIELNVKSNSNNNTNIIINTNSEVSYSSKMNDKILKQSTASDEQ